MISFINEEVLQNPLLSKSILDYFNQHKNDDDFYESFEKFMVHHEMKSSMQKSFSDFSNTGNVVTETQHEYLMLDCALCNVRYKVGNITSQPCEIPLSAYRYVSNNLTSFGYDPRLASLLYK